MSHLIKAFLCSTVDYIVAQAAQAAYQECVCSSLLGFKTILLEALSLMPHADTITDKKTNKKNPTKRPVGLVEMK